MDNKICGQVVSTTIQFFKFFIVIFTEENLSKYLIILQNKYFTKN